MQALFNNNTQTNTKCTYLQHFICKDDILSL